MPITTINNAWDGIKTIDADLSQGHVSTQEASKAVNDINDTWDKFAKRISLLKTVMNDLAWILVAMPSKFLDRIHLIHLVA